MAGELTFRVDVTVEIFPERLQKLAHTPDGPVGRHINGLANQVLSAARDLVGKKWSGTTGKPKEARSGHLRDSGSVQHLQGSAYSVAFNHPIAFIHHEGASTHTIPEGGKPNKTIGGKRRVFLYNPKVGFGPVYRSVTHPGHAGNPFLINAAQQVGLRGSGQLLRGPTRAVPIFRSKGFF